jgi:hypothetical protein
MKIAAWTCIGIGLLAGLMAILTALEVSPAIVSDSSGFNAAFITTAFWGGASALLLLAAIAFGVTAEKE